MSAREDAIARVVTTARVAVATLAGTNALETLAAVKQLSLAMRDLDTLSIDEPIATTADEPVTLQDAFTGGAMYVAYAVAAGRVPTPVSVRAAADLFVAQALREAAP